MAADTHQAVLEPLERHRKIVFKLAGTYAWQPADRADLVQRIATQRWRAFPGYDPARRFPTWMYRIALNVATSNDLGHRHPGSRRGDARHRLR